MHSPACIIIFCVCAHIVVQFLASDHALHAVNKIVRMCQITLPPKPLFLYSNIAAPNAKIHASHTYKCTHTMLCYAYKL